VEYAVAAAVAIPVGLLDQFARLRARPAVRGRIFAWWCGRVALECGIAAGALFLAQQLEVKYSHDWYGWVAAGLLGASLAKSYVAEVTHEAKPVAYGLISVYDRLRKIFEDRIDRTSSARQAEWLEDIILKRLGEKDVTPKQIGRKMEGYVRGLGGITSSERTKEVSFIHETLGEEDEIGAEEVRRTLIFRAADLQAWDILKGYEKTG
jgi:hypothetical protein